MGTEMIIFPDSGPDLKIYAEAGLALGQKLTINQNFQTSAENVFALDEVGDFPIRLSSEDPNFPPKADPLLAEDEAGIVPKGTAAYPTLPLESSLALLEEEGKVAAGAITGQPQAFSLTASPSSLIAELEKRITGAAAASITESSN